MKIRIFLIVIMAIINHTIYAQTINIDTLLGSNGIFKRFNPKDITDNQVLSFNLRVVYTGTDLKGKAIRACFYANTVQGYVGMPSNSDKNDFTINPNAKDFRLMVYSHSLQNFIFSSSRKGKTVMSMPFRPDMKKSMLKISKGNQDPKTLNQYNLKAYPYTNEMTQDKATFYLTDANLNGSSKPTNQLTFAGLGFHQIDNRTVLCMALASEKANFEIEKIETVKVSINMADFKKEEMEGMNEAVQEMMKKLKKN